MDEYPSDHSTLAIICSILGAIAVMILGAWLCLSPLTQDGSKRLATAYESETTDSVTETMDGILGRSGYSGTWTSADGSRSYSFSVSPN